MSPTEASWRPASSVIRGCWQLSTGHGGEWSRELAFQALDEVRVPGEPLVLDCADIYGGVESLLGEWLRRRSTAEGPVSVHTKFVPDLDVLERIDRPYVRRIVDRSRARLGVDVLDLVQFHWWDFSVGGWIRVAEWLTELQEEGAIRALGVTNFDASRLGQLLDAGIPVVSNQVQFSLLDRRPAPSLAPLCQERDVVLLGYGVLAGGLLCEGGRDAYRSESGSRSLTKYRLIVDELGGAGALDRVHRVLETVARRHGVTKAEVAAAYVLALPAVGGVILGLSRRGRRPDGRDVALEADDRVSLDLSLENSLPGAVYELERDRQGPHGRIMSYDLNRRMEGS